MPHRRPHLFRPRSTGQWWYRRRWSKDVATIFQLVPGLSKTQQTMFMQNLGTGDLRLACGEPWRRADALYERRQSEIRRGAGTSWTTDDFRLAVADHYSVASAQLDTRLFDRSRFDRLAQRIQSEDPALWVEVQHLFEPSLLPSNAQRLVYGLALVATPEVMRQDLQAGDLSPWEPEALQAAASGGIMLLPGTPAAREYTMLHVRGQLALAERVAALLKGDFGHTPRDPLVLAGIDPLTRQPIKRVLLDDVLSGYEAERGESWDYKARKKWEFVFRLLREAWGGAATSSDWSVRITGAR